MAWFVGLSIMLNYTPNIKIGQLILSCDYWNIIIV